MKKAKRKLFSPFDAVIIFVAVVASAFALVSQLVSESDSLSCVIRVSSEVVYRVELTQLTDEVYVVDGEFPVDVVIADDGVYVKSASCPDKLCEHTGKISRSGQSIVCLPAKVTVTLESNDNEFDAVVG